MKLISKLPAPVESKYYLKKSQLCGLKIKNFQTKGRARGVAGLNTTLNGHYDVTGIIGKILQVNCGFYARKKFLRELSALGAWSVGTFRQACPKLKTFKKYRFEGAPYC